MKVIIAGGRDINRPHILAEAIEKCGFEITEVVSGGATGADHLGELYATLFTLKLKRFPADWKTHGKAAGPIRNKQMAEYGEALIALWDGESRGTKNMIDEMKAVGKPIFIHYVPKQA